MGATPITSGPDRQGHRPSTSRPLYPTTSDSVSLQWKEVELVERYTLLRSEGGAGALGYVSA